MSSRPVPARSEPFHRLPTLALLIGLAACAPQAGGTGPGGTAGTIQTATSASGPGQIPTRPGVTQSFAFTAAANPVANVLLFPGGDGVLAGLQGNFLVRIASQVASAGMNVAILDVPSDQPGGLSTAFRTGEAQAEDVAAVIAYLRSRSPVPVWLVGTSRGSISAASAAQRLGPSKVAGLVLTSSVWAGGMASVPLGQIAVPTLIVHNRTDGCYQSPFAGAAQGLEALTRAPARELIAVSGGSGRGSPCQARSPHGFNGIESEVVPPMLAWIKAHSLR